jgi:hypothetical protein
MRVPSSGQPTRSSLPGYPVILTRPGKNIRALHPQLFSTGSDVLDDILGLVNNLGEFGSAVQVLPGFNLLTKYGSRLVGRAAHQLHEWWHRRGSRALYGIDDLSQELLLQKLPTYLGADLMDALSDERVPRLVVMFDTYEALLTGCGLRDGQGALLYDDWVRTLVQDAPGVLFVIAGRDHLRWGEIDADWNRVIERHLLGGLTRPDVELLLDKWQIEKTEIRAHMIDGAKSREFGEVDPADDSAEAYLPYYLQIQLETYWDIKAAGRAPTSADFGGDHREILPRLLNHLDTETETLLRLASYPAVLDLPLLEMLRTKFFDTGSARTEWSRLYARSFVSDGSEGGRLLHDLMSPHAAGAGAA